MPEPARIATPVPDPRRWWILAVLAFAQFMVVLDVTIVNVALPDIQGDLGFSENNLQWVINAYALAFGGLLLLGGRAGDLLGRRRVFLTGVGLFTGASLVGGFATSSEVLIASRALQGVGGALLSPAALSLVTATFTDRKERQIALGVWGALAGLGGTLGVVAGGVLVDALSWNWVLWVNVPIGAVVVPLALLLVRESRGNLQGRSLDILGAVTATLGVLALVYGVIRTQEDSWGSAPVIGLLTLSAALLAAFVMVERRTSAPLVPLRLFRSRALSAANVGTILIGGAFIAMFFLTALYLQSVLGSDALDAGLQFVPMGVAAVAAAVAAPALVERFGVRPVMLAGAVVSIAGLGLLSQAGADPTYAADVLPGLIIFGLGIPLSSVPMQIAAVSDVPQEDAGAASGVVNASFQIGGALGLAIASTLATSRSEDILSGGATQAAALAEGFERGILVVALFSALLLVVAAVAMPRVRPDDIAADDVAAEHLEHEVLERELLEHELLGHKQAA